jgi:ribosomal protein L37E
MEQEITEKKHGDTTCGRCGLRAFGTECPNCGTPLVDKKDDEEEEYDWRETKR